MRTTHVAQVESFLMKVHSAIILLLAHSSMSLIAHVKLFFVVVAAIFLSCFILMRRSCENHNIMMSELFAEKRISFAINSRCGLRSHDVRRARESLLNYKNYPALRC